MKLQLFALLTQTNDYPLIAQPIILNYNSREVSPASLTSYIVFFWLLEYGSKIA